MLVSWTNCLLTTVAVLSIAVACQRDGITHTRVAKTAPSASQNVPPTGMLPVDHPPIAAGAADLPSASSPSGTVALKWKLPQGWSQQGASGMRYATLKPATSDGVEISVVVLHGDAGGELSNVNRWRGQLGLPPLDEPALKAARQTVTSAAGPVSVYDFTSQGPNQTRMLVGWLSANGESWFLKMAGDAGLVSTARPDFLRWVETLKFDAANR